MKNLKLTFVWVASLFLFCLLSERPLLAQSALMNVPSTDVVAAKKVYFEFDFITNYAWERDDPYANYLPRGVVGIGKNMEVGVNVSYTHVRGGDTHVRGGGEPIEVQPNIKWRFHQNEARGTAGALGCILYVPVTHRAGTDTFGMCYTVFSKQFKVNHGPTFTGGTYALVNRNEGEGARVGAIAAYEQPLTDKLSFTVDWFSGRNRFGFITPGLTYDTTSDSFVSAGYTIANHGRGNNALFVYYGKQF